MTPPAEPDIRAELDRILASKGFSSAGRISKLLRYIVDKTLAGETGQLKEYSVGIEVFDRDDKYDPRLDSIVRVEAGRLRSRLDEYYNGDGAASAIRISLPKGGYVAQFDRTEDPAPIVAPQATSTKSSRALPFALALFAVIGALVFVLVSRNRHPVADSRPTAAVLPFEANMIGGDNDNYSAQMTEAVTSELARLGTISVASYTSAMQFEGRRQPMSAVASALNSHYVVEGSVDDEASEILIVARIVNAETDRKMWVQNYRGQREDVRGLAQRIAYDVAVAIREREATLTR